MSVTGIQYPPKINLWAAPDPLGRIGEWRARVTVTGDGSGGVAVLRTGFDAAGVVQQARRFIMNLEGFSAEAVSATLAQLFIETGHTVNGAEMVLARGVNIDGTGRVDAQYDTGSFKTLMLYPATSTVAWDVVFQQANSNGFAFVFSPWGYVWPKELRAAPPQLFPV